METDNYNRYFRVLLAFVLLLVATKAHVHKEGELYCRRCGALISNIANTVEVSKTGTSEREVNVDETGTFVQHFDGVFGSVDIVTVSRAERVSPGGPVDETELMFKNYNHQPIRCARCGNNLGFQHRRLANSNCGTSDGMENSGEISIPEKDLNKKQSERTLEWALSSLRNKCLDHSRGGYTFEFCHEKTIAMINNDNDKHTELGKFDEDATTITRTTELEENSYVQFGDKMFKYLPNLYSKGESCLPNKQMVSNVKVLLMCCDSFSEDEITLEENERENLRIEFIRGMQPCNYELYVCVPRLCYVETYEYPDSREPVEDPQKFTTAKAVPNKCPYTTFFSLIWGNLLSESSKENAWIRRTKPTLKI